MTEAQKAFARRLSSQVLAHRSKSFALAGKLLPAWCRRDAAALYAWCRRCDDAVDFPDGAATRDEAFAARRAAVARLREELEMVYGGDAQTDPILAGFQEVVLRNGISRRYADDLINGMAMDVGTVRYRTTDELLLYCYGAAGTVGLMMAQLMKVREAAVLRRAADLGMAMQLTNICRDVAEDHRNGRVYLPQDLLRAGPTSGSAASSGLHRNATASAVRQLLLRADALYRSGDVGLPKLPLRCAMAIRAARLIYAEIGAVITRDGFDVLSGRATVSRPRKLWLLAVAVLTTLGVAIATRMRFPFARADVPAPHLPFVVPLGEEATSVETGAGADMRPAAVPFATNARGTARAAILSPRGGDAVAHEGVGGRPPAGVDTVARS